MQLLWAMASATASLAQVETFSLSAKLTLPRAFDSRNASPAHAGRTGLEPGDHPLTRG